MSSLAPRPAALRSRSPRPPISSKPSTAKVPSTSREPAHLPLHRRLLFPQYSPDKALPRIIQGEGKDIEVLNERLYHLLALILRGYVLSWYPRFSKDRTLLPILARTIIVPIIQEILQRIHDDPAHLAELVLVELPTMLELHVKTYWEARASLALGLAPPRPGAGRGAGETLREQKAKMDEDEVLLGRAYHARLPLPGVIPSSPLENAFPGADPTSTPYRTPVIPGQYIASPAYLTALTESILARTLPPEELKVMVECLMAREILARAVLVTICRRLAEPWTWYTLLLKFLPSPRVRHPPASEADARSIPHIVMIWFFRIYDILLWAWVKGVAIIALYTASPPLQARYRGATEAWLAFAREATGVDGRQGFSRRTWRRRMAWGGVEVAGTLCGGFLDRLLPHHVHSTLLTPRFAIRLTEITEVILFPNGYPAPSPPDPSPIEVAAMRKAVNEKIALLIPPAIQVIVCPDAADIAAVLDPLSSAGCNAHLVAMLLDGVVRALDPEMSAPPSAEPADQLL